MLIFSSWLFSQWLLATDRFSLLQLPLTAQQTICQHLDIDSFKALLITSQSYRHFLYEHFFENTNVYLCFQTPPFQSSLTVVNKRLPKKIRYELKNPPEGYTLICQAAFFSYLLKKKTKKIQNVIATFPFVKNKAELHDQQIQEKCIKLVSFPNCLFFSFFFCQEKTDLYKAARNNDLKTTRCILQKDPEQHNVFYTPHANDFNIRFSPIFIASMKGYTDIVNEIIQYHPYIHRTPNLDNNSSLHAAAIYGHPELFEFFLKKDPFFDHEENNNQETPLIIAIKKGFLKIVESILTRQPQALKLDQKTAYALCLSIYAGHTELVKTLFRFHPHLFFFLNYEKNTALHVVGLTGNVEILQLILNVDPNSANFQNDWGDTAFHIAAWQGHLNAVKLFLKYQPQCYLTPNHNGVTALFFAAAHGHDEIVKLILKKDPQAAFATEKNQNTALHASAMKGQGQVCRTLLKHSPDLAQKKNSLGQTALDFALEGNNQDTIQTLLTYKKKALDFLH